MPRRPELSDEERTKIKQEIKERFDLLDYADDPEVVDILALSRPMCKDCYFFKPPYEGCGECRNGPPPWVVLDRMQWCGKWWSHTTGRVESAYRRLLIENKD